MKRLLIGLVGLASAGVGIHLLVIGQPDEGAYRYPAAAREEARTYAARIADPAARRRFLEETTGRVKIEHPREILAGSVLAASGLGLSLASLRRRERRTPPAMKQAA
jgi:hypothetical protein